MTERESLSVIGVHKSYGDVQILKGIDVVANKAQLLVISGLPSSGKTVLARIICGLEYSDSGEVHIANQNVTYHKPALRNIGYVPQSFALFPNMSVFKNIAYPLIRAKHKKNDISTQVRQMAEKLGIDNILANRVDQISGGQKQRVAIARGLVKTCALYVLDDPLVGLDFKLREQLALDLRKLQKQIGVTFLYLTGDPLEPLMLGDSVAVLADGQIKENSPALKAYKSPKSVEMARVLGFPRANFCDALISDDGQNISCDLFELQLNEGNMQLPSTRRVSLLIRPEHIGFDIKQESENAVHFSAELQLIEDIGVDSIIHLQTKIGKIVACQPSAWIRSRSDLQGEVNMWIRSDMIKACDYESGLVLDCTFQAGIQ